jgi:hypothetical protein
MANGISVLREAVQLNTQVSHINTRMHSSCFRESTY